MLFSSHLYKEKKSLPYLKKVHDSKQLIYIKARVASLMRQVTSITLKVVFIYSKIRIDMNLFYYATK